MTHDHTSTVRIVIRRLREAQGLLDNTADKGLRKIANALEREIEKLCQYQPPTKEREE